MQGKKAFLRGEGDRRQCHVISERPTSEDHCHRPDEWELTVRTVRFQLYNIIVKSFRNLIIATQLLFNNIILSNSRKIMQSLRWDEHCYQGGVSESIGSDRFQAPEIESDI
jgi:hypothetical protein